MSDIQIGRLLRSTTSEFVVGCRVSEMEAPEFGALVRVPLGTDEQIYGLIYDMQVADDGLVRQLVTTENVDEAVIQDNRVNRNVPVEMSVLAVGYRSGDAIRHLLPPRPPLSLDVITRVGPVELAEFTAAGRFGYFRHVLRAENVAVGELLAAHLRMVHEAQAANGDANWINDAAKELITLLRDDYPRLMAVLGALSDAVPSVEVTV